jgi:hypothetical protein
VVSSGTEGRFAGALCDAAGAGDWLLTDPALMLIKLLFVMLDSPPKEADFGRGASGGIRGEKSEALSIADLVLNGELIKISIFRN